MLLKIIESYYFTPKKYTLFHLQNPLTGLPSDIYIAAQVPTVQVQNERRQRRSTESDGRAKSRSIGSNKIIKGSTHTSKSREG